MKRTIQAQQDKSMNSRACSGTLDQAEANLLRWHASEWREPPGGCSLDRVGYTPMKKAREATDTAAQYTLSLAFGSCRSTRPVKAGSRNGPQLSHVGLPFLFLHFPLSLFLLSRVPLFSHEQDEKQHTSYSYHHTYERSYVAQPPEHFIVGIGECHIKKQTYDNRGPRNGYNRSYRLTLVLLLALVHSSLLLCHCGTLVYTDAEQLAFSNRARRLASGADQVTRTALVAFPESEVQA